MNIALRKVEPGDLPTLFEHQQDPVANAMAAFPPRDREAFDAHWARILSDPTLVTQTILVDGDVAGNVVMFPRDGRHLIGYWIGREWWGQGIATAALWRFLEVFTIRPLHAFVATTNVGSRRVLEKCGFTLVEVLPHGDDGVQEVLMVLER
ncbi:MAG TPA: GNAT family N-acetyltransferase [Candidatus Polarisedimenticolaceae bacterium]|nr:GNAT family N-acetyltransferase [Candidatus Polarisedimenticolaceae bacterium]